MSDTPTPQHRHLAQRELNRAARTGDPLSPIDRDILGHRAVRLHVPLHDPVDLRRIATILRELANGLEVASGMRGDARSALFTAKYHLKTASNRLQSKPTRNIR